jgi:menaquinone-specific isochorismate synthase
MSIELLPHLVARILNETKGPLFFLQEARGKFVLGWGARRESHSFPDDQESVWLGGKSFFAGFNVDPPSLKPAKVNIWQDFPERYFFVPRFFVEGNIEQDTFTFYGEGTSDAEDKAWENFLKETQLRKAEDSQRLDSMLNLGSVLTPHARREWDALCEKIEAALLGNQLTKVVPARKKTFISDSKIDAGQVFFRFLAKANANTNVFAFRHNQDVMIGATPEMLFSAKRDQEQFLVQVPAIAGTRPRGKTATEDSALAKQLLESDKENREHQIVVKFICDKLAGLGTLGEVPETPIILQLPKLQHLFTNITASLRNQARVWSLLDSLHPTPAVGGFPQAAALELLCRYELWERGYFASPLGYLLNNKGESGFVVGIRSCLISDTKVHVFAGAGYVAGSSADDEWTETKQKLDSVLHVFGKVGDDA